MNGEYERWRRHFEALEQIAELDDQVELDAQRLELMQNPTKVFAAKMYKSAVLLWLAEHGTRFTYHSTVRAAADDAGVI